MKKFVPLIVGIDGLLGKALWNYFRDLCPKTLGTSRRGTDEVPFLDLSSPHLDTIDLQNITHALITGGNPNIRNCEMDPISTGACNLVGTLDLAHQFSAKGIQPILFSTDYVFDGVKGNYTEDDIPSPLNQYGWQKAELEKRIHGVAAGNYLMIRLAKVILQTKGQGLIGEIADSLHLGRKVRAATDLLFTPVLLNDVVLGIRALIEKGAKGLYNLAGPELWTRYDLSLEIGRKIGVDSALIEPISLDDLSESFKRPKRTDLNTQKFEQATGLKNKKISIILEDLFAGSK